MNTGSLATSKELAKHLGVSPGTIERMVRDKQLPTVRVRCSLRFNIQQVEAHLTVAPCPHGSTRSDE